MDKTGEHLYFAGVLAKYILGVASDDEIMKLKRYMDENLSASEAFTDLRDTDLLSQDFEELSDIDLKQRWDAFEEKEASKSSARRRGSPLVIWLSATAAILIAIVCLFLNRPVESNTSIIPDHQFGFKNDVTPGHAGATLTLADGRVIELGASGQQGKVIDTGMIHISNGSVEFRNQANADEYRGNRIHTPKGGTFQTILADGTKIWLNANSEIEFPMQFSAKERRMKLLSGEAFFEVAKNKQKPFIVETQGYAVHVIGTAFNINNYQENIVKTLLTEGKVEVIGNQTRTSLSPGQAVINKGEFLQTEKADINEALSWRDGYFYFDGKTLPEILDEVSRWYDISVDYRISLDQTRYMGGAKRSITLGTICKMLTDMSEYAFEINGKKLIVTKNKGGKMK
ncbi:FecR family protein [Sphingobacterium sp. HMA12]|uniref:FecR family protein n=1 Tax=Sphingobacterium sp. HMA12 TaxID=2050894 RepID=UPI000CEA63B4|nr:FecR family protein [Sphingobacterium sp. HMA12]